MVGCWFGVNGLTLFHVFCSGLRQCIRRWLLARAAVGQRLLANLLNYLELRGQSRTINLIGPGGAMAKKVRKFIKQPAAKTSNLVVDATSEEAALKAIEEHELLTLSAEDSKVFIEAF
jgi:hypothetical protein